MPKPSTPRTEGFWPIQKIATIHASSGFIRGIPINCLRRSGFSAASTPCSTKTLLDVVDTNADKLVHGRLPEPSTHKGALQSALTSRHGYEGRRCGCPGSTYRVGSFTRAPHNRFLEYPTSADYLDLVRPKSLCLSLFKIFVIVDVLERNRRYLNAMPRASRSWATWPGRHEELWRGRNDAVVGSETLRRPTYAARHRRAMGYAVRRDWRRRRPAGERRTSPRTRRS